MNYCVQLILQIDSKSYCLYCHFSEIEFLALTLAPPDCAIQASLQGSVGAFLSLLLSKNPTFATQQGLLIEGDPEVLRLLEQWSNIFEFETIIRTLIKKRFQQMIDFKMNDEQSLAPKPLMDQLFNQIDDFRTHVNHFEARLTKFLAKHQQSVHEPL